MHSIWDIALNRAQEYCSNHQDSWSTISIKKINTDYGDNLKFIYGDPWVVGEALKHRDEEHEAARPVDNEKHHADQVEDFHENSNRLQELNKVIDTKNQIIL